MGKIERKAIVTEAAWLDWRKYDITASTVGALFGLHPYETIFALYARATGTTIPDKEDTAAMQRGRDFEAAVAARVQRNHPEWRVRKANHYLRDPTLRLGATPDYYIRTDDGRRGILQIKTVAPFIFRQFWTAERAPAWVALQTLTEMILAKASFGIIAALENDGWRYNVHEYDVPRHEKAESRIKLAVAEFWHNVETGKLPDPDYSRDGALIAAMTPHAVKGKEIDLRADNRILELLEQLEAEKAKLKQAKSKADTLETEIKAKIGDAEIAIVNGWSVKCIEVKEALIKEHTRNGYRMLRAQRDESNQPDKPDAAADNSAAA